MEEVLNIEDVVALLRVDADTVIGLLQSSELDGFKMNDQWRIRKSDLASFLDRKVESQRLKALAEMLSDPKKLTKMMKSVDPVWAKEMENAEFPKNTLGAWLKKGLLSP